MCRESRKRGSGNQTVSEFLVLPFTDGDPGHSADLRILFLSHLQGGFLTPALKVHVSIKKNGCSGPVYVVSKQMFVLRAKSKQMFNK